MHILAFARTDCGNVPKDNALQNAALGAILISKHLMEKCMIIKGNVIIYSLKVLFLLSTPSKLLSR